MKQADIRHTLSDAKAVRCRAAANRRDGPKIGAAWRRPIKTRPEIPIGNLQAEFRYVFRYAGRQAREFRYVFRYAAATRAGVPPHWHTGAAGLSGAVGHPQMSQPPQPPQR